MPETITSVREWLRPRVAETLGAVGIVSLTLSSTLVVRCAYRPRSVIAGQSTLERVLEALLGDAAEQLDEPVDVAATLLAVRAHIAGALAHFVRDELGAKSCAVRLLSDVELVAFVGVGGETDPELLSWLR